MKKLLLFNGSPRKNKTSYSFARTIKALADKEGHSTEIVHIIDYYDKKKDIGELKGIIEECDLIGLSAPLYVDCLPSYVIWFFEELAGKLKVELKGKDFFAIGQCGFPDITMNEPLLESTRLFAVATGMKWLGGLSYGGGAMLDGGRLEDLGKKGEKMTLAFKLALDNLLQGKEIPQEAQELLTLKIPKILYQPMVLYLNYTAKRAAKKKGLGALDRRVYLE